MINPNSSIGRCLTFLKNNGYDCRNGHGAWCFVYVLKINGLMNERIHKIGGAKELYNLQSRLRAPETYVPAESDVIAIYAMSYDPDDPEQAKMPYKLFEDDAHNAVRYCLETNSSRTTEGGGRELYEVGSRECVADIDKKLGAFRVYCTVKPLTGAEKFMRRSLESQAKHVRKECLAIKKIFRFAFENNRRNPYSAELEAKFWGLREAKLLRKKHMAELPLDVVRLIWDDDNNDYDVDTFGHIEQVCDEFRSPQEQLRKLRESDSLTACHERISETMHKALEHCENNWRGWSLDHVINKDRSGRIQWTVRSLDEWKTHKIMFLAPLKARLYWFKNSRWRNKLSEQDERSLRVLGFRRAVQDRWFSDELIEELIGLGVVGEL